MCKPFAALITSVALSAAGMAYAGPPVTVIVKNQSSDTANFLIERSGERFTYANASPKPDKTVLSRSTNTYSVRGPIAADITTAHVRYETKSGTCEFSTTYIKTSGLIGSTPKWEKSANSSGRARCAAAVTSINPTTHAWTVEFTIR